MAFALRRALYRMPAAASVGASAAGKKVCVVGAAGGIGQPLSLLLKSSSLIRHLSLYDVATITPGVAADLSHIPSSTQVTGHSGEAALATALKDSDVVVVPAGVPRKPGMTRDDLFNINATIVANVAKATAQNAPNAALLIISNPVNSTVPICAEILRRMNAYNPKKLFGVTTLDVIRANTFVAAHLKRPFAEANVRVIGGHAGITIIPLLSQVSKAAFSDADRDALTQRIMFGGDEVVKAKAGAGSATLSMAYAGARFTNALLRGLSGDSNTAESFVESAVGGPELQFFASPVVLGPNGAEKVLGYGEINAHEKGLLKAAIPELKASIQKGIDFAKAFKL